MLLICKDVYKRAAAPMFISPSSYQFPESITFKLGLKFPIPNSNLKNKYEIKRFFSLRTN
jgi:hypothetical protein